MTNNRGYIYVLANSAMPDLVKVGKTTRSPAERAAELSKVTGVPTPFIVVYEQLVDDCTAAEQFVHTMLQQKGYRESDNREFFRAPVSEVIQIIIKMPNAQSSNSDFEEDEDAEFFSNEPDDELDEFVLHDEDEEQPNYPWLALWEMAEHYYDGDDDYIQDYEEAMKLYKQAIKLGCLLAYKKIGDMYLYGFGVSESDKKALDWYKEGVKKGNYYCYTNMAEVFWRGDKTDNFHKCLKLYFKNTKEQPNEMIEGFYYFVCATYIIRCFQWDMTPLAEVIEESCENKRSIILSLTRSIEGAKKLLVVSQDTHEIENFGEYIELHQKALKWVEENL